LDVVAYKKVAPIAQHIIHEFVEFVLLTIRDSDGHVRSKDWNGANFAMAIHIDIHEFALSEPYMFCLCRSWDKIAFSQGEVKCFVELAMSAIATKSGSFAQWSSKG